MPNNFGGDQNDPEYDPSTRKKKDKPPAATRPLEDHLRDNVKRARKELRHRAHVYAHTKEGPRRDTAGEELDKAALALALAASLHGLHVEKET